jgi:hypothetical protein
LGGATTPTLGIYAHDPDSPDALSPADHHGIASVAWDFGDGATATGWCPSHVYTTTGDYDITATVTDADGATTSFVETAFVRPGATRVDDAMDDGCPPSDYGAGDGGAGSGAGGQTPAGDVGGSFGGFGVGAGGGGIAGTPAGEMPATPPPVTTPPPVESPDVPSSPSPTAPSPKELRSALGDLIERAPSYRDLAKDGIVKRTFAAPSAGTLHVRWFIAKRRKDGKVHLVLIAQGTRRFGASGKGSFSVKLTRRGRRALKKHHHPRVRVVGTFTPARGKPTSTSKTLVVGR